jgi:hypothetical protein
MPFPSENEERDKDQIAKIERVSAEKVLRDILTAYFFGICSILFSLRAA